jgi:hypothetical protein
MLVLLVVLLQVVHLVVLFQVVLVLELALAGLYAQAPDLWLVCARPGLVVRARCLWGRGHKRPWDGLARAWRAWRASRAWRA